MVDNNVENEALAAKQPEIDSLLAQKDAAETRVLTLEAEKLAVDKPRRLKLPDVDQWNECSKAARCSTTCIVTSSRMVRVSQSLQASS